VSAGTFCEPGSLDRVSNRYSNHDTGRYGRCYIYDEQGTFDYLASRGVDMVKIEFRWETIQPNLGKPLQIKAVDRLAAAVDRARAAGLKVILDMHNFGAYYLWDGTKGVRREIGTRQLPIRYFADVWSRISSRFRDVPDVYYALMCEPIGLPKKPGMTRAELWERASQAAFDAVRDTGDTKTIFVDGYQWASLTNWSKNHPDPWIVDPLDNFYYEAHHYWDREQSGAYEHSYADEVDFARSEGW
jgi:endoglucanase